MDLKLIQRLSLSESKDSLERFLKLGEECGELAQELLIARNASGFHNKSAGADGICGEAVDVLLVALSIFFCHGGSIEELAVITEKKSLKWRDSQAKKLAI